MGSFWEKYLPFENGIFPDSLKIAEVTPVYKSGDSSSLSNYRPIFEVPFFLRCSNVSCIDDFIATYRKIQIRNIKKKTDLKDVVCGVPQG